MPRKLPPRDELVKAIKDHTPNEKHPFVNPYANVEEAIYDNDILTDLNDPRWAEFAADPEIRYLIAKGCMLKMRQMRNECYDLAHGDPANGVRPNERFMLVAMKSYANDDQLARLGGGGVKMDDVRNIGADNRKTLVIQPTVVQQVPEKKTPNVEIADAEVISEESNN